MSYKWTSVYDWLADYTRDCDKIYLYNALCLLAQKADPDDLQDIFQQEMDESGYFQEEK